jgi:stage IV sporulation protein FB
MRALQFSGRRFSLAIEPTFWLVMGVLALTARDPSRGFPFEETALLFAALALSVLLHEGGHAAVVILFGGDARVRLHGMGGATSHELKLPLSRQFAVTAAGPLAGFAAAGAAYELCSTLLRRGLGAPALVVFLTMLIRINVFWSVVNLLPILPMDGGKLLALAVTARFGAAGMKFVYGTAVVLGGALGLWALASGMTLTAATFGLFAVGGVNSWRLLSRRTPQDDDPALQRELRDAEGLVNAGRHAEALPRLIELRRRTGRGRIFEIATELLGILFFKTEQNGAAVELLSSVEPQLAYESRALLMRLLCDGGAYERALTVGRALFPQRMDPEVAFVNAAASLGRGDRDAALSWLKTAVRRGLPDAAARLREPAFDALRATPDFADLERAARGAR